MYSGPSCFSSRLWRVAISWAVYSDIRGLTSSKGFVIVFPPVLRCCSPGLQKSVKALVEELKSNIRRHLEVIAEQIDEAATFTLIETLRIVGCRV